VDVRSPGGEPIKWQLSADVEALAWNPQAPTSFLVSCEDGIVACFDARSGAAPLFRLAAHDKPTCTMTFCPSAPGLLATGSTDKKVRGLHCHTLHCHTLLATRMLHTPAQQATCAGHAAILQLASATCTVPPSLVSVHLQKVQSCTPCCAPVP
jgi:hypothetical protein